MFDNGKYLLCELNGLRIKVLIAGIRVKLFKRIEGEILIDDQILPPNPGYEDLDASKVASKDAPIDI